MRGKKIKRKVKTSNFLLAIFNRIKQGKNPSFIRKEMGISKQKLYYYTSSLKKQGIIGKHRNGEWFVKVKNFSIGERDKTDLHALNIKFPILSGRLKDSEWEIRNKLKNWTPKYKEFDDFGGITIRNNNNKSISVFLKPRKIDLFKDREVVNKLANRVKTSLCEYFRSKHDVILDSFNAEVKNIHLETYDKFLDLKKGEMIIVDLGRKSEKIFSKDNIDAKAWGDNSPDPNMHGTNDLLHKKYQLLMPEKTMEILDLVKSVVPSVHYIAQNYASHVGIVEKLNKLLDEPKVKKHIKKKAFDSKQTTLE